jgi:hypothetical protein
MVLGYFTNSSREDENLPILEDTVNWLKLKYNLPISVVRFDSELNRNKTKAWLINQGLNLNAVRQIRTTKTAPQKVAKARAMRLSGRLPTLFGGKSYQQQYIYTTGPLGIHWDGKAHTRFFTII